MIVDTPTISRLSLLFPDFASRLLRVYQNMYEKHRLTMRCSDGMRDIKTQAALYAQGRTAPGAIVTYAEPGDSWHNYGLAADSCFFGNDPYLKNNPQSKFFWSEFGSFAKMEGLTWGGDFPSIGDNDHVEDKYGLKLSEVKDMYEDGGLANVWQEIIQQASSQNDATPLL